MASHAYIQFNIFLPRQRMCGNLGVPWISGPSLTLLNIGLFLSKSPLALLQSYWVYYYKTQYLLFHVFSGLWFEVGKTLRMLNVRPSIHSVLLTFIMKTYFTINFICLYWFIGNTFWWPKITTNALNCWCQTIIWKINYCISFKQDASIW